MQLNILWTGREYYSLENCLLNKKEAGTDICSTIIGKYYDTIYQVDYHIKTNQQGATTSVDLKSRQNDRKEHVLFGGDGNGNWTMNGKPAGQFTGCIDVDIPLTPFTNTLPITRLSLKVGAEKEIGVIYFDVLAQQIRPVRQKYTRLSETIYQYQNIPNDFEAKILVDE